jgi:hypothetical protein
MKRANLVRFLLIRQLKVSLCIAKHTKKRVTSNTDLGVGQVVRVACHLIDFCIIVRAGFDACDKFGFLPCPVMQTPTESSQLGFGGDESTMTFIPFRGPCLRDYIF